MDVSAGYIIHLHRKWGFFKHMHKVGSEQSKLLLLFTLCVFFFFFLVIESLICLKNRKLRF